MLIKSSFSRRIPKQERISASRLKKRERGIWQRCYWEHVIRDNNDYARHIDYIHYNPVKHVYVKSPVDWPYSSLQWTKVRSLQAGGFDQVKPKPHSKFHSVNASVNPQLFAAG